MSVVGPICDMPAWRAKVCFAEWSGRAATARQRRAILFRRHRRHLADRHRRPAGVEGPWRDVRYPWERTSFARHEVFRV
jgi:hypothetical protein